MRLQSLEGYISEKTNNNSHILYTKDYQLKAYVDNQGSIILSKSENYDRVQLHKLKNMCELIEICLLKTKYKKLYLC